MTPLFILIPGDKLEGQVQLEKISTLHSDHDIAKYADMLNIHRCCRFEGSVLHSLSLYILYIQLP